MNKAMFQNPKFSRSVKYWILLLGGACKCPTRIYTNMSTSFQWSRRSCFLWMVTSERLIKMNKSNNTHYLTQGLTQQEDIFPTETTSTGITNKLGRENITWQLLRMRLFPQPCSNLCCCRQSAKFGSWRSVWHWSPWGDVRRMRVPHFTKRTPVLVLVLNGFKSLLIVISLLDSEVVFAWGCFLYSYRLFCGEISFLWKNSNRLLELLFYRWTWKKVIL